MDTNPKLTPDPGGDTAAAGTPVHRRRPRYPGRNPRKFEEKYKEHPAGKYVEEAARIEASGKTLAGTHRPILVREILEVLRPIAGQRAVDCTLGFGGHARELLRLVAPTPTEGGPAGCLLGLDVDPLELPRTEARLREMGYGPEVFVARQSNYAGLSRVLGELGWDGADVILADLGVSSMQLDNPERGFTFKFDGPLDLRMNPHRGVSAADWLAKVRSARLALALQENADEPRAEALAAAVVTARQRESITRTRQLADCIRAALAGRGREEQEMSIRRVFQALRIAVNDEFSALDAWLRHLPACLRTGGRVAVLTFHSGEDRRVKRCFREGLVAGHFAEISDEVTRPGPEELRSNPRSAPAKLRWAVRA